MKNYWFEFSIMYSGTSICIQNNLQLKLNTFNINEKKWWVSILREPFGVIMQCESSPSILRCLMIVIIICVYNENIEV